MDDLKLLKKFYEAITIFRNNHGDNWKELLRAETIDKCADKECASCQLGEYTINNIEDLDKVFTCLHDCQKCSQGNCPLN